MPGGKSMKNMKIEEMFAAKELGKENAEKVIRAMQRDPNHFGFIKTTAEKLAELKGPMIVTRELPERNKYFFCAGGWVIMIIDHKEYVEVQLHNPYDPTDEVIVVTDI